MPRITPIILECIFLKAGFTFKRQVGSHRSYVKQGVIRPIVIPTYKEIDVRIIKSNLKTAQMSRDDYFKYLQECK